MRYISMLLETLYSLADLAWHTPKELNLTQLALEADSPPWNMGVYLVEYW